MSVKQARPVRACRLAAVVTPDKQQQNNKQQKNKQRATPKRVTPKRVTPAHNKRKLFTPKRFTTPPKRGGHRIGGGKLLTTPKRKSTYYITPKKNSPQSSKKKKKKKAVQNNKHKKVKKKSAVKKNRKVAAAAAKHPSPASTATKKVAKTTPKKGRKTKWTHAEDVDVARDSHFSEVYCSNTKNLKASKAHPWCETVLASLILSVEKFLAKSVNEQKATAFDDEWDGFKQILKRFVSPSHLQMTCVLGRLYAESILGKNSEPVRAEFMRLHQFNNFGCGAKKLMHMFNFLKNLGMFQKQKTNPVPANWRRKIPRVEAELKKLQRSGTLPIKPSSNLETSLSRDDPSRVVMLYHNIVQMLYQILISKQGTDSNMTRAAMAQLFARTAVRKDKFVALIDESAMGVHTNYDMFFTAAGTTAETDQTLFCIPSQCTAPVRKAVSPDLKTPKKVVKTVQKDKSERRMKRGTMVITTVTSTGKTTIRKKVAPKVEQDPSLAKAFLQSTEREKRAARRSCESDKRYHDSVRKFRQSRGLPVDDLMMDNDDPIDDQITCNVSPSLRQNLGLSKDCGAMSLTPTTIAARAMSPSACRPSNLNDVFSEMAASPSEKDCFLDISTQTATPIQQQQQSCGSLKAPVGSTSNCPMPFSGESSKLVREFDLPAYILPDTKIKFCSSNAAAAAAGGGGGDPACDCDHCRFCDKQTGTVVSTWGHDQLLVRFGDDLYLVKQNKDIEITEHAPCLLLPKNAATCVGSAVAKKSSGAVVQLLNKQALREHEEANNPLPPPAKRSKVVNEEGISKVVNEEGISDDVSDTETGFDTVKSGISVHCSESEFDDAESVSEDKSKIRGLRKKIHAMKNGGQPMPAEVLKMLEEAYTSGLARGYIRGVHVCPGDEKEWVPTNIRDAEFFEKEPEPEEA